MENIIECGRCNEELRYDPNVKLDGILTAAKWTWIKILNKKEQVFCNVCKEDLINFLRNK